MLRHLGKVYKHKHHFHKSLSSLTQENIEKNRTNTSITLPNEADVVIIGGGSIGCNTAYSLTKLGATNIVLLEKDQLTAGTTWHTAGLIWRLRSSDVEIELQRETRHLLKNVLEQETGVSPGWIENGGLFIASSKMRGDEYKRLHSFGKALGIESQILSPQESKKLYPLLNVKDLYCSLYSPGDGTLDPSGFCTALSRAASKAGAKIIEKCAVTGIKVYEDDMGVKRVQGVETNHGFIKTKIVVNCTGVWAPVVGQMAGVHVPIVPLKHAYVVTERIEGIQNMPNIRDHDGSVYLKVQGDNLAIGGYERNPIFCDSVPNDFAFSLYELDWDTFGCHLANAISRISILEKVGIKSTVCGPESFTPDHKPIMGEDPFLRGFFHGAGFNSGGMMLGGGCGRELARWIYHGRPELDMFGYDIRRFSPKLLENKKWMKERCHESFALHYNIQYKHDEPLSCRNQFKDPFYNDLTDAGCVFEERLGWERSGWFSPDGPSPILDYDYYGNYGHKKHENYVYRDRLRNDYSFEFPRQHDVLRNECLKTRNNVAVFNMSYFGKFYLVGPEAQKAADWIFTNDMTKPEGATVYTCMLNKRGCIEADLTVSSLQSGEGDACDPIIEEARGFYIAAGGASSFQNYAHIVSVIEDRGFNAILIDRSHDLGMLSIQGPKSRELLQALTDTDLSDKSFPFSTHKIIQIGGYKVRAMRLSFVGELGWELHIPIAYCVPLYRLIMNRGQPLGVVNAGYRAIDSLSIEKGYRHWHADIRLDDTPLEAGLGFTCKLKTETPFLGREVLLKQKKEGLKKRLVCFTIDQHVPLFGMEAIYRDGVAVGFIRRAEYAFALGCSLGYGYVSRPDGGAITTDYLKNGKYELERMGERIATKIHLKTPFDPNNKRVKGQYDEPLPINIK